ncbi:MAG TPA: hypothetical protein PKC54_01805 [Ferruginibacter sp.]|nr:hypothetical protein [Ferruginibacter sp.]
MKKIVLIEILLFAFWQNIYSQDFGKKFEEKKAEAKAIAKDAVDNPNKNFKSIFTDIFLGGNGYYQALIKNGILKQGDGEVKVNSTIYGLIRIFDSTKREDQFFKKLRWARNIQIGAGAVFDDDNKIKAVNSSLSVAVINKRVTNWRIFYKKFTPASIAKATANVEKAFGVVEALDNKENKTKADSAAYDKAAKQIEAFGKNNDFSLLKGLITDEEIEEAKTQWESLTKEYNDYKKKLTGAPLLTFGYEGDYGNNKWSKVNAKIEFLVGFGAKKDSVRNYDFYTGVFYNMNQDTLNKTGSLNRKVLLAKVGFNKVLIKAKTDGSSVLEVFGGGEYQNINSGIYVNEVKSAFKFNASLSFRLAPNLYLPIQVKWNTNTGRFEGYLDLKFDILTLFK